MTHVGFRYTVEWHTPYTDPPEGQPFIKAEMFESIEQRNDRMDKGEPSFPPSFSALHVIGDGYCVTCQAICTPSEQLPKKLWQLFARNGRAGAYRPNIRYSATSSPSRK